MLEVNLDSDIQTKNLNQNSHTYLERMYIFTDTYCIRIPLLVLHYVSYTENFTKLNRYGANEYSQSNINLKCNIFTFIYWFNH